MADNDTSKGKIIVISAPSGTGKSTVIKHLMQNNTLRLKFSISATCRPPRGVERNAEDYYFMSREEFMHLVSEGKFVEWEEVYPGCCYGTLRTEIERVITNGDNLIMDIDVKGALNIKKEFGQEALSIFLMPPSIQTLEQRLRNRGTDTAEVIDKRLQKAEYEMSFATQFDSVAVNDRLDDTIRQLDSLISEFVAYRQSNN